MNNGQRQTRPSEPRPSLAVEIAGIRMKNPVMPASGTFGYGEEFAPFLDLEGIGAIVTKGLSLRPKAGNPTPRIAETVSGMLNAIGLQNVGVDAFVKHKLPYLREINTPVIVNFFGNTLEEYAEVARRLSDIPEVAGVELNISCPNVKQGGIVFGTDPKAAHEVVSLVRRKLQKPLIVKLTPNVTDITVIARAVEEAGADAICCINTLTGMSVDIHTRKPRIANRTGGLSGPAIRPVAGFVVLLSIIGSFQLRDTDAPGTFLGNLTPKPLHKLLTQRVETNAAPRYYQRWGLSKILFDKTADKAYKTRIYYYAKIVDFDDTTGNLPLEQRWDEIALVLSVALSQQSIWSSDRGAETFKLFEFLVSGVPNPPLNQVYQFEEAVEGEGKPHAGGLGG